MTRKIDWLFVVGIWGVGVQVLAIVGILIGKVS